MRKTVRPLLPQKGHLVPDLRGSARFRGMFDQALHTEQGYRTNVHPASDSDTFEPPGDWVQPLRKMREYHPRDALALVVRGHDELGVLNSRPSFS